MPLDLAVPFQRVCSQSCSLSCINASEAGKTSEAGSACTGLYACCHVPHPCNACTTCLMTRPSYVQHAIKGSCGLQPPAANLQRQPHL